MWNVTMEDGAVVLGNVELKERTLSLSVNSAARAERGKAMLSATLTDLVGSPLTEIQTVEQMKAAPRPTKKRTGAEIPSRDADETRSRHARQAVPGTSRRAGPDARRHVTSRRRAQCSGTPEPGCLAEVRRKPLAQCARPEAIRWRPTTSPGCGGN